MTTLARLGIASLSKSSHGFSRHDAARQENSPRFGGALSPVDYLFHDQVTRNEAGLAVATQHRARPGATSQDKVRRHKTRKASLETGRRIFRPDWTSQSFPERSGAEHVYARQGIAGPA